MNKPLFTPGRCLIIGEVAQAHDGSLGTAHAYVDAIARCGADAVKFQTHIAAAESTPGEPWRIRFSPQDVTRYDYWKRMEFSEAQWHGLKQQADERGLLFLSSPFSVEAVELLSRVGVAAWKIASGEVNNVPLFDRMAATGLPLLLSSGMSPWEELDAAVARVRRCGSPLAVLQCTSVYPCPPEQVGLNLMAAFRDRYGCAVGLSDHSGTVYAGMAAAALGADVIEVHVTLSRESFGPDVSSSLTTAELQQLVAGVRFIETMRAHSIDKDAMAVKLDPMRRIFTKSIVARVDLPAGTRLRGEDLAIRRPGHGIPATRLPEVLNLRLKRTISANTLLQEDDLEY